jgi:hypothetical protein
VDGGHGLARKKAMMKIKAMTIVKIASVTGKSSGLPEMERLTRVSNERQVAGTRAIIFCFWDTEEDSCMKMFHPVDSAVRTGFCPPHLYNQSSAPEYICFLSLIYSDLW